MKIESVQLENFRQYYGEQIFEFSTESVKSVTIIHGENGTGKTTLLSAIRWCLYGEEKRGSIKARPGEQTLIHTDALHEGKPAVVSLVMLHEGKSYRVMRRTEDGIRDASFTVHELDPIDYNHKKVREPVALINQILPSELSPYFLFHGEGIADLNKHRDSGAFLDAVRKIYGFNFC